MGPLNHCPQFQRPEKLALGSESSLALPGAQLPSMPAPMSPARASQEETVPSHSLADGWSQLYIRVP